MCPKTSYVMPVYSPERSIAIGPRNRPNTKVLDFWSQKNEQDLLTLGDKIPGKGWTHFSVSKNAREDLSS